MVLFIHKYNAAFDTFTFRLHSGLVVHGWLVGVPSVSLVFSPTLAPLCTTFSSIRHTAICSFASQSFTPSNYLIHSQIWHCFRHCHSSASPHTSCPHTVQAPRVVGPFSSFCPSSYVPISSLPHITIYFSALQSFTPSNYIVHSWIQHGSWGTALLVGAPCVINPSIVWPHSCFLFLSLYFLDNFFIPFALLQSSRRAKKEKGSFARVTYKRI